MLDHIDFDTIYNTQLLVLILLVETGTGPCFQRHGLDIVRAIERFGHPCGLAQILATLLRPNPFLTSVAGSHRRKSRHGSIAQSIHDRFTSSRVESLRQFNRASEELKRAGIEIAKSRRASAKGT